MKRAVHVILAVVLTACASPTPEPTATPAPTDTPPPTATPTYTPTLTFTPTLQPTPTSTFAPKYVVTAHAFMDPILGSIEDRDPDYQNDFSDPKSGWPSGKISNDHQEGVLGYENGEYFMQAAEAKFYGHGEDNDPHTGIKTRSHSPIVKVLDFAMEVDVRFVTLPKDGEKGSWAIEFWRLRTYYYSVHMNNKWGIVLNTDNPLIRNSNDPNNRVQTPPVSPWETPLPSFMDYQGGLII